MYCRKKCSSPKATLTSLDHVLVSHQKGNECRGEQWQKRTRWLSSFSAHHPLNISSNLIFCFPCAWCCIFSSATINLLTWEENQTHWSMGCAPWLLPLWQWWWEAENFGCSLPCLCSYWGGEGTVRQSWSRFCQGPAIALLLPVPSWMLVFSRHGKQSNCPGSASTPKWDLSATRGIRGMSWETAGNEGEGTHLVYTLPSCS